MFVRGDRSQHRQLGATLSEIYIVERFEPYLGGLEPDSTKEALEQVGVENKMRGKGSLSVGLANGRGNRFTRTSRRGRAMRGAAGAPSGVLG